MMLILAIWDRAWPSTLVKLPTTTSSVFCVLLDICSTLVTVAGEFGDVAVPGHDAGEVGVVRAGGPIDGAESLLCAATDVGELARPTHRR